MGLAPSSYLNEFHSIGIYQSYPFRIGVLYVKAGPLFYSTLLGLAIIGLAVAFLKYRSRKVFLYYFTFSGLTLFFDFIIYVIGKAYKYHPGIISGKYDTHLGALINAQIVPSTAVLFYVFNGSWLTSVLLALMFAGIEVFLKK